MAEKQVVSESGPEVGKQPGDEKEYNDISQRNSPSEPSPVIDELDNTGKSFWNRLWPVIACGAGLFSDGYLNGVSRTSLKVERGDRSRTHDD